MGEKMTLPYPQGKMLTYDVAVMLEAIAADLRQRTLAATSQTGPMRIELPTMAKLEIAFKQKIRPDKTKQKLTIEMSWKENLSEEQTETATPDALPAQEPVATLEPAASPDTALAEEAEANQDDTSVTPAATL